MGAAPTRTRLDGIDAARGFAIALMFLSHTVKSLLSFKLMPDYGVVPIHLVTKFSSSLFILVFGVSMAVIYVPKVGTEAWPAMRWKLVRRGLLVMFWYKVLAVVQMFERADPQVIIDTLLWKRFPDFVEILQFYGWFLLVLPLILPLWRSLWVTGKLIMTIAFGFAAWWLHQSFEFWDVWQLKAVIVESPKAFCFGVLTRGTMALAGMLLGEILTMGSDRERQQRVLGALLLALGGGFLGAFFGSERDTLAETAMQLAKNWGKHPPNVPFITFTFGGAFVILGACLLAGRALLTVLEPLVILGRESLFCFNFHILAIFLGYRYYFGLRRQVTYEQALWLTAALIAMAVLTALAYNHLKRSWRGRSAAPARAAGATSAPAAMPTPEEHEPWIWDDTSDEELAELAARPTVVDRPRRGRR